MGNHHSENLHNFETKRVMRKRHEMEKRRQSMPLERLVMNADKTKHSNFTSFAYGERERCPRIQINGQASSPTDSLIESYPEMPLDFDSNSKMLYKSPLAMNGIREEVESSPPKRNRFIRNPKSAASRRIQFLSFTNNFIARSLDETSNDIHNFEIEMKPLSHRARSLSPLKQLRTYSLGSIGRRFPSDESVLSPESCLLIKDSWKLVNDIIALKGLRPFGFLVLKRVFEKIPSISTVFKIDLNSIGSLENIPQDHSFIRHTGLFQSIIDLAVRNVDELEAEIAPAVFIYGRRHFEHDLNGMFNEETVRLFCGQVVCTVLDLIGHELSTECLEAWIEFMRYLGRTLLDGYEFEAKASKKKFSISSRAQSFFIT